MLIRMPIPDDIKAFNQVHNGRKELIFVRSPPPHHFFNMGAISTYDELRMGLKSAVGMSAICLRFFSN